MDVTPSQEMVDEGIAREVVNKIQKLRKKVRGGVGGETMGGERDGRIGRHEEGKGRGMEGRGREGRGWEDRKEKQ